MCSSLKGTGCLHLVYLVLVLQGRQLLWLPVCFPAYQSPSEKGSALKEKNLLPGGSKFFSFRVESLSEGRQNDFDRSYLPWKCIHSPKRMTFESHHRKKGLWAYADNNLGPVCTSVTWSIRVAEWLAIPTSDLEVPGLNLAWGKIQLMIVWHFIVQSFSLLIFCHVSMA